MILDDIEFDSLARADILLLALLRPQLWSVHLHAHGLRNNELRERLTREVAHRAAQTSGERARLAFERNEDLPFPDFARQTQIEALDAELALERVRLNWLEFAETAGGIEQLNAIEQLPLHTSHADVATLPAWAKIAFGLAREFTDETHDLAEVGAFVAEHLAREQANWSVTVAPLRVCYNSETGARDEAGVELGLIRDPRAPLGAYELAHRAFKLADEARAKFGQHRLCISFPDCVVMLESKEAPLPLEIEKGVVRD